MSGGVDSSVAAYLALRAGYDCIGGTMLLCGADCPSADARRVAEKLDIPFFELPFQMEFDCQVIRPFITWYEDGLTPNPCIFCNRQMKFGALLRHALSLGCSHIVTGHYCTVRYDSGSKRYCLYRASDSGKDQTYFLAGLTQHQLSHSLFPLGGLTKEEVRQIAQEQGFLNADKRDSQDICFIPDGDYKAFMQRYTGKTYPPGDFLDLHGNVIGHHNGAVGYTPGQRKGLGVAFGAPMYVYGKDVRQNTVTLAPDAALYAKTLIAGDWNWIPFAAPESAMRVTAKVRYRHTQQPATVYPEADGTARVEFDEPQRAITPGQAVVLYDGDLVVGSGTISCVIQD